MNETGKRKAAVLKMSGRKLAKDRDSCLFPMPTSTAQTDWSPDHSNAASCDYNHSIAAQTYLLKHPLPIRLPNNILPHLARHASISRECSFHCSLFSQLLHASSRTLTLQPSALRNCHLCCTLYITNYKTKLHHAFNHSQVLQVYATAFLPIPIF